MNLLALVAGVLTLTAFGAHAVVGASEFRQFAPEAGPARTAWVQALSGWHWVSATLLAAALLLLVIGCTDVVPQESAVLLVLSAYFGLSGAAWLATVAVSGTGVERRYLVLGQWLFCFLIAGLAFFAA